MMYRMGACAEMFQWTGAFMKLVVVQVYEGIIYMGVMVICMTMFVVPIYFPMWGGMLFPPKEGVTEEDYYQGEFTEAERASGLADAALKFAQVCRELLCCAVRCCVQMNVMMKS
jgi:hypothetical protein